MDGDEGEEGIVVCVGGGLNRLDFCCKMQMAVLVWLGALFLAYAIGIYPRAERPDLPPHPLALTPPPSPPTTPQLITSDLSSPPGPLPNRCQATAPTSGVITNDRNTPPLLVFPSTTFPTLWLPLTTDAPATVTPKNKFCLNSE